MILYGIGTKKRLGKPVFKEIEVICFWEIRLAGSLPGSV